MPTSQVALSPSVAKYGRVRVSVRFRLKVLLTILTLRVLHAFVRECMLANSSCFADIATRMALPQNRIETLTATQAEFKILD